MNKIPVSMILCAMLGATTTFGQVSGRVREGTQQTNTTTPKQWDVIKEEDIAWKKRVWRTIDLSDKENAMLNASATHASIGEILLSGLYSATFKTYKATDDRFTTALTPEDVEALRSLRGQKITFLKIKEDWIMLKKDSKMIVRIVAMAPVTESANENQPAFWIYYPEARTYLSQQPLAIANDGPANFDEVFEGRFFTSKIDKTSESMAPPAKDPNKKW